MCQSVLGETGNPIDPGLTTSAHSPPGRRAEAFLGDAEAGVRIREVDDSMLGPWPREDVLALLAALKASLRLLPDGVPRQLARPQVCARSAIALGGTAILLRCRLLFRLSDHSTHYFVTQLAQGGTPDSFPRRVQRRDTLLRRRWYLFDAGEPVPHKI